MCILQYGTLMRFYVYVQSILFPYLPNTAHSLPKLGASHVPFHQECAKLRKVTLHANFRTFILLVSW